MRLLSAVFLLVALLAAAGCAGPRPATAPSAADLPAGFPHHSVAEIEQHLLPVGDSLYAFTNKARLTLRSPEQNGSFSADLVHRRNDSLYMAISPGLGIEAVRVLITPDSFFVYDRLKRRLTYGSRAYAEENLPAALAVDDLFGNLLGLIAPAPNVDWQLEADERYYYLRDPEGQRLYVVDPALWRVVRYEVRDADGLLVDERVFSDFERIEGVLLPRRLSFRQPQSSSTAAVYYRDVDLNPKSLHFDLGVRPDAERVQVN